MQPSYPVAHLDLSGSARSMMNLRPGSPQGAAPHAPRRASQEDSEIGGNMALGSNSNRRSSTKSSTGRGGRFSMRGFGGGGGGRGAAVGDEDAGEESDLEGGTYTGRNAVPDDFAE